MDRRQTVSGCSRGEQRRRYDERRRIILPQHGIRLVELDYSMFECRGRKRLRRVAADEMVVMSRLAEASVDEKGSLAAFLEPCDLS
jgi:hypothetical protein